MRMLLWAAVLAVSGCAGSGQYPLSRATAGPDDPVLRLTVPPLPSLPVPG